jgi:hypothetical protein
MPTLDQVWRSATRAGLASNSLSLRAVRSRIRSEEESSDESGSFVARCAPLSLSLPPPLRGRVGVGGATGEILSVCTHSISTRSQLASAKRNSLLASEVSSIELRLRLPPSPTLPRKGGGRRETYCVFATRGGVAVVMNCVASSIATPSGVGITMRNGTRMRVPSTGAKAISMLRWAVRYLITGRSGM